MCERIHQLSVYSAGVVWDGDRADYTLMNHSRREPFQQPAHTGTKQGSAEAGVEGEPLFVHPPIVICKPEEPGRLYLAQGASSYNAAPLTTGSRDSSASGNSGSQRAGAVPLLLYLQVWI